MKFLKHLKTIDIFSQPIVSYQTSRDKKNNRKEFSDSHGSVIGGLLTIICFVVTFGYISSEFMAMINGESDNYNQRIKVNTFEDGLEEAVIQNDTFLPVLEIEPNSEHKNIHHLKLFDDHDDEESFEYNKLKEFIEVNISIKTKKKG